MELEGLIIMNLGRTSGTSKAGNAWKKMNMCLRHQVLTRVRLSLRYSETAPTIYSLKTVKICIERGGGEPGVQRTLVY